MAQGDERGVTHEIGNCLLWPLMNSFAQRLRCLGDLLIFGFGRGIDAIGFGEEAVYSLIVVGIVGTVIWIVRVIGDRSASVIFALDALPIGLSLAGREVIDASPFLETLRNEMKRTLSPAPCK